MRTPRSSSDWSVITTAGEIGVGSGVGVAVGNGSGDCAAVTLAAGAATDAGDSVVGVASSREHPETIRMSMRREALISRGFKIKYVPDPISACDCNPYSPRGHSSLLTLSDRGYRSASTGSNSSRPCSAVHHIRWPSETSSRVPNSSVRNMTAPTDSARCSIAGWGWP